MRPRWLVLFALCLSLLPLAPQAPMSETPSSAPDAAIWKNGDLMPPLPVDETVRAQALAQVERAAQERLAALPGVVNLGGATTGPRVMPVRATPRTHTSQRNATPDIAALRERIDASTRSINEPANVAPSGGNTPAILDVAGSPAAGFGSQPGIDDTGLFPASPDISIGTEKVIIATTNRFQVRDRCGTPVIDQLFGTYFNLDPTITFYDPVTIYDEWSNRYIVAYLGYRNFPQLSYVYLAVSENGTADTWYYYPIPLAAAGNFADDVSIAVSPFGIYLTGNEFDHINYLFEGTTIIELNKSDIYSELATSVYSRRNLTHPVDASQALSVRPAQMHSFPGAVYFVAAKHTGSNQLSLYTLTGLPGSSSLASVNVPGYLYSPAGNIQQPNLTFVRSGDCRIMDAAYDAGFVYVVQTTSGAGSVASVLAGYITVGTATSGATVFGGPPSSFYPAIDVDDYGRVGVVFSSASTTEFISMRYAIITPQLAQAHDAGIIQGGLANYTAGGTPYRWGNHNGIARDPVDDHSFWMHAAFASNSPTPSWTTLVYRAGTPGPGDLAVTAPANLITAGFEGGPFNPTQFAFQLQNNGPGTASWKATTWPAWADMSATSGAIAPYSSQTIYLLMNSGANNYPEGYHLEILAIENCTGTGGWYGGLALSVGKDYNCPGATSYMFPLDELPTIFATHQQPSLFVTAIEDVNVCAIGIYADIDLPQHVTVGVYTAAGTTPGALIYGTGVNLFNPEPGFHYIPVDFEMTACYEYYIGLNFSGDWSYPAFDETIIDRPIDSGGVIRVRDGAQGADASPFVLAPMLLVHEPTSCPHASDVADFNDSDYLTHGWRGIMITANETRRICSVGINLSAGIGTRLTANVNDTGTGTLLATGSTFVTSSGMNEVQIPVSAVLIAGHDYNIDVMIPGTSVVGTDNLVTPYTVDWFDVTSGSRFGSSHPIVTDMTLGWTDDAPGYPYSLVKAGPPPYNLIGPGPVTRGIFTTSLVEQELYMLGVRADVPAGETITARIYRAAGNVRGPLLSEGTIVSGGAGDVWHDVPVAVSMGPGEELDFEVDISQATTFLMHDDSSGLPYNGGMIEVRDGEQFGNAAVVQLPRMRAYTCNRSLTPVPGAPGRTPMFLANPTPNPASNVVRFGYSIEAAGPAELAIYDVAGRLVDRVFQDAAAKAGNSEAHFDASRLASGVYFAKLTTSTKSLSRKFVVTH